MQKIKVTIPASVANIVCGYDILGMALNEPYDTMELELTDSGTINITHTDGFGLPESAEKNVAGVALKALMKAYDKSIGFNLSVHKTIKPGSGLGSSAAGSAGAVKAANFLLNNYFSNEDLVRFAMKGEELASGVEHADNIAPCIYGSVTLVRSLLPLDIVRLEAPPLFVTVIHPQIEIKTSEARAMLPKDIPLKEAVKQWANIAGLVTGFLQNDYGLISRSLEDVIIEKVRSVLIPGFDEIKKQSRDAGALGGGISGSGPSVFMLNEHKETADRVRKIMEAVYDRLGIDYRCYVTTVNREGIKIIQS